MITTTWTNAPADLLGLGGAAVRPCTGMPGMSPQVAPVQGTGVPAGSTVARVRADFRTGTTTFDHNYIGAKNDGTTLGNHPPGRPQS
jgi:hypothetical protein